MQAPAPAELELVLDELVHKHLSPALLAPVQIQCAQQAGGHGSLTVKHEIAQ